ncbi:aldo/keto reductase [Microlunatus speluncae]|uniref:aldo/keto reductase n=1 Tax=Microlunatus speluncae TaxID=2594267 RepID=UPI0012661461|nr:aldo/keto reductase [Microlunatus speluncae]
MRYRRLGGTGIEVSSYCLGAMMFGSEGNPDHDECIGMIHTALDAGINFIDTADAYGGDNGESEEIVGAALEGRRDEVVLATKVHFPMSDRPNHQGNSRLWITRAVEDSLRRLRTDRIDLYQVHRPDPHTDIEETLSVLSDLVHQGKIRAFGCSTFPVEEIVEAHRAAADHGLLRFRTEQPPYSILTRGIERTILPLAHRYRMGVLTWGPLGWGFLTGRIRRGEAIDLTTGRARHAPDRFNPDLPENQRKLDAVEELITLADELGCTLPQLAVAFPLAHPAVSSVILGPRTPEQLDGLLAGAELTLDDATLDRIDEIVPPGTDLIDLTWKPPSLTDPTLRRRPVPDRAASKSNRLSPDQQRVQA